MNWRPISEKPPMPQCGIFARAENAYGLLVRWVDKGGFEQFSVGGCQQVGARVDFYSGDIDGNPNRAVTHWCSITPPNEPAEDSLTFPPDQVTVVGPCRVVGSYTEPVIPVQGEPNEPAQGDLAWPSIEAAAKAAQDTWNRCYEASGDQFNGSAIQSVGEFELVYRRKKMRAFAFVETEDAQREPPLDIGIEDHDLAGLRRDAERWRKLRAAGTRKQFGPYIVIRTEDAKLGIQAFTGQRLDEAIDAMPASADKDGE